MIFKKQLAKCHINFMIEIQMKISKNVLTELNFNHQWIYLKMNSSRNKRSSTSGKSFSEKSDDFKKEFNASVSVNR